MGIFQRFVGASRAAADDRKIQSILSRVKPEDSGCWIWTGTIDPGNGYGRIHNTDRKRYAHRVSYETFKGVIPEGQHVLHTCDCKACANPDHLYIGTPIDNARDYATRTELWVRNGRLRPAQVLEIVFLRFEKGWSYNSLSERFHASQQAIANICRGRSHAKLTGISRAKPAPVPKSARAKALITKSKKTAAKAKGGRK